MLLFSGSSQPSATCPSPGVAVSPIGASGTANGVALTVAAAPFSARTAKVYDVPLVSWSMVWLVVVAPLPVMLV